MINDNIMKLWSYIVMHTAVYRHDDIISPVSIYKIKLIPLFKNACQLSSKNISTIMFTKH